MRKTAIFREDLSTLLPVVPIIIILILIPILIPAALSACTPALVPDIVRAYTHHTTSMAAAENAGFSAGRALAAARW